MIPAIHWKLRTRWVVWSIVCICGVFLVGALSFSRARHRGARLAPSQHRIDFGVMERDAKATAEIALKNTGTETLHISSIVTECGCTSAIVGQKTLAVGAVTQLSV